jgi:hypothetical protein
VWDVIGTEVLTIEQIIENSTRAIAKNNKKYHKNPYLNCLQGVVISVAGFIKTHGYNVFTIFDLLDTVQMQVVVGTTVHFVDNGVVFLRVFPALFSGVF